MKIILVFALVLATLIQLCPAPFVPALIAGAAEAGADVAASVGADAAAAAANDNVALAVAARKDQWHRSTQPTTESLHACWLEALKVAPQVRIHNESSITLTGLHSCWTGAINGAMYSK
jgi:hypothetical protein